MKRTCSFLIPAVLMLASTATTVAAQEIEDGSAGLGVSAGVRVGGIAPQPFNELGSFVIAGIEAGYALPVLDRRLSVGGALVYSRPPASGGGDDGRLSGGSYDWELDQTMWIVELNAVFRLLPPERTLVPYARLGGRLYMLDTSLDGESGASSQFGEHSEGSNEPGFAVGGGADYAVGPGSLVGELAFGFSKMNEKLTGDTNTGALEISVGYRMSF